MFDSEVVDCGKTPNNDRSRHETPAPVIQIGAEIGDVLEQEVANRTASGHAGNPQKPTGEEADERAECGAGVHERPAGLIKSARHLRETQNHKADDDRTGEDGPKPIYTQQGMHLGGQAEDAGAHYAIDYEGEKIPSTQGAQQSAIVASIR